MEMDYPSPHQIKSIDNQQQHDEQRINKKGGLRTMPFVISNEALEKVAGIGLLANMILYLKNEYNMSNATGATVLFLWSAISNFMPIFGAFLSDSFLGRFRVIALGTISSLLGMSLLWLTAVFPGARPPDCKSQSVGNCASPKADQLALLFSSFALMSVGAGGVRPCSLAFGADQFYNPSNPNNDRAMHTFFNWYYASVGVSIMLSITVIVYIQDKAGWVVGFGVPVGLMCLSTAMFLLGSPIYIKIKADKSLFTSFVQVIAAAWKNRHLASVDSDGCYYHKGSKLLIAPSQNLRFLNKACVIRNPDKDLNLDGWAIDPWSLCTVKEVEELKALIRVLPIWSTGIMLATTISQHTFPLLQATVMDRHFFGSGLQIPAGSFGIFAMISLTIWVVVYDRIIVPLLAKFTKRARGLTFKERMGIGLVISCASTAVAATIERRRRTLAIRQGLANHPFAQVHMSAMWLVPQYSLIGLAEGFNAIGQIEFYYSQFPKSMASIGVALFSLGMAVGNVVGSMIVAILNSATKKHGKVSWVSNNLNKGHYDYYYWILTILSVVNVLYYLVCAWTYGSCENKMEWDEAEELGMKEEDIVDVNAIKGSPIVVAHSPLSPVKL